MQRLESTNFYQIETNSINHIAMKKLIFFAILVTITLNTWTCSIKSNHEDMFPKVGEVKVSFELVSNNIADSPKFLSKFTLENNSEVALGSSGWTM